MSKIIITGGAGFIGSHIAAQLREAKKPLQSLDYPPIPKKPD
ncbi:NAD(P)-dependent oxidoreductase [candidate division WOR-3 bacterium]|nr:NAD(P)-dependent oxidoreductase [candidate division WOR-3 bacterium]